MYKHTLYKTIVYTGPSPAYSSVASSWYCTIVIHAGDTEHIHDIYYNYHDEDTYYDRINQHAKFVQQLIQPYPS